MNNDTLLLEIGLEELPARFVNGAMNELAKRTEAFLSDKQIDYDDVNMFATPRRLAVKVNGVSTKQPDQEKEAKGPAKKIALDEEGNWTKAAIGFAKGQQVNEEDLFFKEVKGVEYVYAKLYIEGQETLQLLSGLHDVITGIPFPKNMRWGSHEMRYARPVRWLVAMYGEEVIPLEIAGVMASNVTQGHRFLGQAATLNHASDYEHALLSQHVVADPFSRKDAIKNQIQDIASEQEWQIPMDEGLLEEVTQLVEYPTALFGSFDERFLAVPDRVLITSMREHQRYFPVQDQSGSLLPYFVTVRNGDHRHLETVQKGNEKVLRARLQDAEFFFNEDKKHALEDNFEKLHQIVYHEDLGTIADKVDRVQTLAEKIGSMLSLDSASKTAINRAARLSKNDLVTQMVNEFTELEGYMGEVYALKSGETPEVATAIREHYLPKQSGDPVPSGIEGAVISVADKLDTIAAHFSLGNIPTGSQDPHGLRRQTAAIVQIFRDFEWTLSLNELFNAAQDILQEKNLQKRNQAEVLRDFNQFVTLRYKNILQESGIRYDVVDAVLAFETDNVPLVFKKAAFLNDKLGDASFKEDVEAFSRVTNIASKKQGSAEEIDQDLFESDLEVNLYQDYERIKPVIIKSLRDMKPEAAYQALREAAPSIHKYFDGIMVMTDDEQIRENRLTQMSQLAALVRMIADFQSIVFHTDQA
ncbi:glycine--tRNA ligase subunit beta [Salisediminibacterium selenitireducens]|uniref:Glycine--tRNA ligase beta subunit n=1 Tax=Bacillus selenitireducens (strain ATCC 700615 / DSM 15326 / MLS10) TaxID=439292 RepID=D6XWA0_BACIE|nr:glycine--tRNA ligase subunit beta [Salisediminibacterium selenitireducens]ADH99854.1 glycyl-tRNA synthetase, beta subunit [[Bacillus] selenitireducens MLS10]